tara:strand:+ start:334 stop:819 length:486 start_codon:yes stop_codon:yes gene_type:complete
MKKLFMLLFVGSLLASCGGSSYTTDKESALEMKKEQTEALKGYYAKLLDINTEFEAAQKEILADYGGKSSTLWDKAKTNDDAAMDAWADLQNLSLQKSIDIKALNRITEDFDDALQLSIGDIRDLNEPKDLEAWSKSIEAENKIANDLAEASNKAISELRK